MTVENSEAVKEAMKEEGREKEKVGMMEARRVAYLEAEMVKEREKEDNSEGRLVGS